MLASVANNVLLFLLLLTLMTDVMFMKQAIP